MAKRYACKVCDKHYQASVHGVGEGQHEYVSNAESAAGRQTIGTPGKGPLEAPKPGKDKLCPECFATTLVVKASMAVTMDDIGKHYCEACNKKFPAALCPDAYQW